MIAPLPATNLGQVKPVLIDVGFVFDQLVAHVLPEIRAPAAEPGELLHCIRVQNGLDRFHLVEDAVEQLPQLGSRGAYLKQNMRDKLVEHKAYIDQHGLDLPEVRNWKWGDHL